MQKLTKVLAGPQGIRWLAITIACVFVASIASIGQVSGRDDGGELSAGAVETTDDGFEAGTSTTTVTNPDGSVVGGVGGVDANGNPTASTPGGGSGGGTSGGGSNGGGGFPDYGLRTQGVTDKEVKLGISYNTTGCGDAGVLEAMVGAGAAGDIDKAIDAFTRHVNDNGGISGRTLKTVIGDDGGGGCPEKALSAARQLVDDEKVFAVVPGLHEVSDYAASKKVPTFIGRDDPESLERLGPNGIGLIRDIGGTLEAWSAFGRYYLDSGKHKPCLVHPETGVSGDWALFEKLLVADMQKLGIKFTDILVYKEDVATAQQQSSSGVARLKSKGCDQVYFMAGNPIALIFFTQAAENALWYPKWTFTSYMVLADSELGGRLMNQNQWDNAVGLSARVPPGEHPKEGNCKRIYETYYKGDGQSESAAVQLVCAILLPAAEMMRRGERITGKLDANALIIGADAITNDFYFDSHVPLDWKFPAGGPYKSKGFSHYTVVDWNSSKSAYDFPEYPLYWDIMGPNKSNGVDLRPLFKNA